MGRKERMEERETAKGRDRKSQASPSEEQLERNTRKWAELVS